MRLRSIAAPQRPRNKVIVIPNSLEGGMPTAAANAGIPVVTFDGNMKNVLGAFASMNRGDERLFNWSAKLLGGLYGGTVSGL